MKANTSSVTRHDGRVIKRVERFLEYGVFEREVEFLQKFGEFGIVPTLYDVRPEVHEIEMSYCGEDMTVAHAPQNAGRKAQTIMDLLDCFHVHHNDIRPENVTVLGGALFLIDWQWATEDGPPPVTWPEKLGGKFRAGWPRWVFDDRISLNAVLGLS